MPDSHSNKDVPTLSIILPTYNRAGFLPQAFESIRAQTFEDWELIVVDDGSTDDSKVLIERLAESIPQPVRYVYQKNAGPAGARNTGLALAQGKFTAFFDSDDYWLPHHLTDSVEALEENPDVDWVFGPGRRVDHATGKVLIKHDFYPHGRPQSFLRLNTRRAGKLNILEDPDTLLWAIRVGGYGWFQSAVFRPKVFDDMPIEPIRVGEDRIMMIRALARGVKTAYFDDLHVVIYSHDANVSLASAKSIDVQVAFQKAFVASLERLQEELSLGWKESRALAATLTREYFWMIGYPLFQHGRYDEALDMMRRGLRRSPLNVFYWKTYLVTRLKTAVHAVRSRYGRQP